MKKKKIPTTLIAFLAQTIRPHLFWFLFIAILPYAWVLDQVIFPYCMKLIIDTISNYVGSRIDIYVQLLPSLYLGLGAWILLIFVWRFLDVADAYFIPKFQASIRLQLFECMEKHSYRYFSEEFSGSIANKISDLVDSSWQVISFISRDYLPATVTIFISILIIKNIQSEVATIIITFYFTHMCICIFLAKSCNSQSNNHAKSRSILQGNIVDSLTNIINVRLFSKNLYELDHLKHYQDIEVLEHKKLLWKLFNTRLILDIPSLIMIIGIMFYLIDGWQKGAVSLGDFTFIMTVSLNNIVFIWRVGGMLPDFFKNIGVCKQSLAMIEDPYEVKDLSNAKELIFEKGEIIFKHVHFDYSANQKLFMNASVKINAGEKIGLVGLSGSGKSTFINLILRNFNLKNGKILIDGQDISSVTQDSLRKLISVVPQDVILFHRTIMENIRFGNTEASEEEVFQASKEAYCHEFITQFEGGYNFLVGERGIKLSGGQKQRIAIARAILKNAPILILDEATSALDPITEKHIQESLKKLMNGRTTIIIAHRLSTLLEVDRILVFQKGNIVEEGNHSSLLHKNGYYAKLWNMQIGGFLPFKLNS